MAKPSYSELEAQLAAVQAELTAAKAEQKSSSVNEALQELRTLEEKSPWCAEIATSFQLFPGKCPAALVAFGAAFDGSPTETILPGIQHLLPGFESDLASYERTLIHHNNFRRAGEAKRIPQVFQEPEDDIDGCMASTAICSYRVSVHL